MANKFSGIELFGMISETTQNTPVALTQTDFCRAEPPTVDQEVETLEQNYVRTTFDPLPHIIGKRSAKIDVNIPFRWSLASNTANAPLLAALKALGFSFTGGTAAADWTGIPADAAPSNMKSRATSASAYAFKDGLLHTIAGCVGTAKMQFKAGEKGILAFSGRGIDAAVTDQGSWPTSPTATPITTDPPVMQSAALKIDNATGHTVNEIEIDLGTEIIMEDDVSAAVGVGGFCLVGKKPSISLTVLARTVAAYDYWNKFRTGAQINTSSVGLQFVLGTVAMNKFTFTIPTLQINKCAYADIGGLLAVKLTLNPTFTNGADWITLLIDNA